MAGLMDVFLMKERVNEGANPIFIILEKASILIALLIVVVLAVALELRIGALELWSAFRLDRLSMGITISFTFVHFAQRS